MEDPFEDPPGIEELIPAESPILVRAPGDDRLEDDWTPDAVDARPAEEIERAVREQARTLHANL